MFEEALYFFVFLFIVLIFLWYVVQWNYLLALKNVPGPIALPVIGNMHQLTTDTTKSLPVFMDFKKRYGNIFKLFIGFQETVVIISDPDLVQVLLGTTGPLHKSRIYRFLFDWLGHGLLTSPPARWKKFRKIITPAFHFTILEQFLEIFQRNDNVFLKKLEKELHGNSFDVYPYVTLLTLDNIVETSMNTKINAQENYRSPYVESTRELSNILVKRQYQIAEGNPILYKFTKTYAIEKKHLNVVHNMTEKVIKQRRLECLNSTSIDSIDLNDDSIGIKKKIAFLDLLMMSTVDGRPLTDSELKEEVDTFMFEGHDTTASAISYTLYCLSKHPDVQQKVMNEIESIFGNDTERPATSSELQGMKYLDLVIKETLRLYPTVPMIARQVQNTFEYNGVKYPEGTTMQIFIYGILQDEKYFKDATKFDPDRFLEINNLHPYAYIPFSAGPRKCIGFRFASLEIKSTIVNVLRRYEILDAPDCKVIMSNEAVLKSATGINIRIRRRRY
ncbi:cytochrome P450 4d2 [Agrilus planipennis]|uniref:Cytochrome P450 4d2 n=1 Tax=Agrilus planipennis TaxID=224129 RepID=A0A1W4WJM4_AGRPL|nr:cytochrome P450 4d2 [Agrilus planipennis]